MDGEFTVHIGCDSCRCPFQCDCGSGKRLAFLIEYDTFNGFVEMSVAGFLGCRTYDDSLVNDVVTKAHLSAYHIVEQLAESVGCEMSVDFVPDCVQDLLLAHNVISGLFFQDGKYFLRIVVAE